MEKSGSSEAMGSWRMVALRRPRISRIWGGGLASRSAPPTSPPPPLHQGLALLGHHQPPRGLRRWNADAQEAERGLDDDGDAHLQAEEHHDRVHDVGNEMSSDDPELADAVDLRQLHEVPLPKR